MNILEETTSLVTSLGIPVETGVFSESAPDTYCVLTPLSDNFELFGDNMPGCETQEVRISLYSKNNYLQTKNTLVNALLAAGFTITARQYIAHEDDTKYHHYMVDIAKIYQLEG